MSSTNALRVAVVGAGPAGEDATAVAAPPEMNSRHLWTAVAIGLPLSLIAAAVPALLPAGALSPRDNLVLFNTGSGLK